MAPERFTPEEFWAGLEELGEHEVRTRINAGKYSNLNRKLQLAQQWLDDKERLRSEVSQAEEIDIARSAKDAAWAAAEQAREANRQAKMANRIAIAALIVAIIAAICAIISLFSDSADAITPPAASTQPIDG